MARDRFGFLERHGFVNCSVGALQPSDPWSPIDAASSNQLREMCCRGQRTSFQLCFDPPQGWADGQAASQGITGGTTMLCSDFRAPRKNDLLLPDAGIGETIMSTKV